MVRMSAMVRLVFAFWSASMKFGMKSAANMPPTAIATSRQPPPMASVRTVFIVRFDRAWAGATGIPQEPQKVAPSGYGAPQCGQWLIAGAS